ncbi:MAG TPA: carboxypeptidase-like regulatory domain-containing protein, partial [Pyrinomonadaceae bacterium]|nr:carboxypeptidase-like regulatory domain-containing protein [Pyrinomonadaceae bacterium]
MSFVCMKRIASLFIAVFLFAATVFGQQTNGNLRGRVVDATGAVVVGANVTIIAAGSAERSAQTDQNGEFSF